MITVLTIVFALGLFLGVPLAFTMGTASVVALLYQGQVPGLLVPQRVVTALDSFPLMAVPLYILAGEIMNNGGITRRIVGFAGKLIGHIRGGMAHVTVLASVIFAGISGSASADAAAVGSVVIPAMIEDGYPPHLAASLTAAASALGPIIPPSILMIIYGSMTGISIGAMFLGGVIPGLIIAASLAGLSYRYARKLNHPVKPRASLSELWVAFKEAFGALVMPLIVLGGILSGVFTATEAGVIAVVYGLAIGFLYKNLRVRDLKHILVNSAVTMSTVLAVIAFSSIFAWILAREAFPAKAGAFLTAVAGGPGVGMALILLILLFTGLFLDASPALVIFTPVLFPIAQQFGFNPVHFAVVLVITLLIGAVHPPVGVLTYISCGIAGINVSEVNKSIWSFVAVLVGTTVLIAYIPALVTFLPNLLLK